jgi:uncharacterized protein (DUF885 family)
MDLPHSRSGGPPAAGEPQATARFRQLAERVLDALLAASPETATELGDHRFDDQLDDLTQTGVSNRLSLLADALVALDDVDDTALGLDDQVDLELLRTMAARDSWLLEDLAEHESDPLLHLPGDALYPLLAREVADPATRLRALTARMSAVPHRLAAAQGLLHDMALLQVETAIARARGVVAMLGPGGLLEGLLGAEPRMGADVLAARDAAVSALLDHAAWLESRREVSDGDPRLGDLRFAAKLWYTLDTESTPDVLLTRAESDLQAVEEEIAELASRIAGRPADGDPAGQVREVLDRLAAQAPVSDATILPLCEEAFAALSARMRELDLVSVPDADVRIIEMPEGLRGSTVAYCDPPGPLERHRADGRPLPTMFAVAPTPADWPADRVRSFYREYNGHMVRELAVHEAMPGHVLQLAHANAYRGGTRVRAACSSGTFVEGWAVYAEALVARVGLGRSQELDDALRMQQLKMQLRSTINAVLDVRVHAHGMTEAEAMVLMTGRGHQEEGEAAGKWRRALLTSAQLSTYYVGYREVSDLARSLRERRPHAGDRAIHDALLAHGSPPPRHLASLLGLGEAP